VPLAAQSREEPVPYSFPAITTRGVPAAWYCIRGIVDGHDSVAIGHVLVTPPAVPGTSSFCRRMLAKVPRIITSWLPRREP
jgi:hypothetical protein